MSDSSDSSPARATPAQTPLGQTIYLAPEGFVQDLVAELGDVATV